MYTKGIPGRALVMAMVLAALAVSGFSQTAAETGRKATVSTDEISILKQEVSEQQKQIEALQSAVNAMTQKLNHVGNITQWDSKTQTATPQAPRVGQVASSTPVIPTSLMTPENSSGTFATATPPLALVTNPQEKHADETSPLQLRVGNAYITPVGFMDFTSVWRSSDVGSGIGTNFAGIPYGNIFQNNLSEFRLSMQNSRIGFRVDAMVHGAHVIGYTESDFLGNNPGNVAVSSNSNTMRSRLYWVDTRKDKWEVLGGQTWSLMTPGRSGISPLPGDLFFTQNIDVNYQLGLAWGRIPELRFVYHPSNKAALAIALDSPEQYVGGSAGGGLVTFPAALAATYVNELNTGGNTLGVPNVAPDVIAKLALDPTKRFHFEVGGVAREFKLWDPITKTTASSGGAGGFLNLNYELFKGFRVLTNNYVSDGGGRYIFGQAPDLIARADGSPSPIHADSTASGFEYTNKNTLLFGYYGGLYVGRNVAIDAGGKPVGYGYAGSPAGQNRAVQEGTFGFNQTLWKDAKYGALNFMGQYSYLTRNPWAVAGGQPANANLNMVFFDLRYSLPGAAPSMK